jgi:thiol-disulfide isomerase/thioredoxin
MQMKKYISISLLFLIAIYGCNNSNAEPQQESSSTKTIAATIPAATVSLPAFKIVDLNGKPFNLADFKGKKVFINLWASWCPPCRAEIPSIEKLYSKVDKSKATFVMLSLDNDFETAVNYAAKNKMTTPVFYPAENLPSLFNVEGIPATFIFDEKGNLVTQIEGGDDYDTEKYLNLFNK